MEEEVVPTQDLSRILQASKVKRTQYIRTNSHSGSDDTSFEWNDVSDWSSVHVDGVLAGVDEDLPTPTDEKIIIYTGMMVTGVQSHFTRAQFLRTLGDSGSTSVAVAEWTGVTTDLISPSLVAPWTLPVTLSPDEIAGSLRVVVSGTSAVTRLVVQMLSGPIGVMAPFPGV